MINDAMAKDLNILIGVDEYVKVRLFSPEECGVFKANNELRQVETTERELSRAFEMADESILLEFYNRSAVLIPPALDSEVQGKITFMRLLYSSIDNEVSYLVDIGESTFEALKKQSIPITNIEEILFFGDYFQLADGQVIVQWKNGFSPGKYSVLESLRTMLGIDLELGYVLDKKKKEPTEFLEATDTDQQTGENIYCKMAGDSISNLDEIRSFLSQKLNIDLDQLDYSKKSTTAIETSLDWNADNLDHHARHALLEPCAAYCGEILVRKEIATWQVSEPEDYPLLKAINGKNIDIIREFSQGMIDVDYGIPAIDWVLDKILSEI